MYKLIIAAVFALAASSTWAAPLCTTTCTDCRSNPYCVPQCTTQCTGR